MNLTHRLITLLSFVALTSPVLAEDVAPVAPAPAATAQPTPTKAEIKSATWKELLQKKYGLTDAQMQSLADSKMSDPEQAKAAQMAKSSGKSIDEILKMRYEEKMGWGKIAKTLGVKPSELGHAVSELNKERNESRRNEMQEKSRLRKEEHAKERKERAERKEKPAHGKNK